ncbi:type II toxin-antitoxin system ParD family antitoxin [Roseateles sp.]|uniref:type II toxin-antitoxin system ParD family antitoxin n=1 Tax=Roseateles sp. TaxID=1971397 RepID=UPI00326475C0
MNISLPEPMRTFVEKRVSEKGYGSSSEYVRDLIRRDQERETLRALLLEGAQSPVAAEMTPAFFAGLRQRVQTRKRK